MVSLCSHLAGDRAGEASKLRRWILGSFLIVLTRISAPAAETNEVLNAWLAAQKNLRTWTADFTQMRMLKTLRQPLVATGHIWFATPNRFRWELGRPTQTIALRQSDQMFVIYPLLKRAERYRLDSKANGEWREALALLDAGFPRNRGEMESRFHILSLTESNAAWHLTLQPISAFARRMMKEIRLTLATNNFSLASTELIFADDSRMRTDFTNAVLNARIEDTVFDWKPNSDFKVTEPLGK